MHANQSRKLVRSAVVVAAVLTSGLALGVENVSAAPVSEPMIVAQAAPAGTAAAPMAAAPTYPGTERAVRAAAAESPDALRRYIWRTRMIWNYRFEDFVLKT